MCRVKRVKNYCCFQLGYVYQIQSQALKLLTRTRWLHFGQYCTSDGEPLYLNASWIGGFETLTSRDSREVET